MSSTSLRFTSILLTDFSDPHSRFGNSLIRRAGAESSTGSADPKSASKEKPSTNTPASCKELQEVLKTMKPAQGGTPGATGGSAAKAPGGPTPNQGSSPKKSEAGAPAGGDKKPKGEEKPKADEKPKSTEKPKGAENPKGAETPKADDKTRGGAGGGGASKASAGAQGAGAGGGEGSDAGM